VVVAVLLLITGLVGNVFMVARYVNGSLFDSQIVASWQQRLAGQQRELDRIQNQTRIEMEAVGRRLASMQAPSWTTVNSVSTKRRQRAVPSPRRKCHRQCPSS
jgi:hypothetical protein